MIRWWNLWWHCIGKRVRWWPHRFSACCQTFASQYFFQTTYRLNPLVYTTKLTSLITFFKRLQRQGDRDAERQREGPHFITWIQERGLAPGTGARATAPAVAAPQCGPPQPQCGPPQPSVLPNTSSPMPSTSGGWDIQQCTTWNP